MFAIIVAGTTSVSAVTYPPSNRFFVASWTFLAPADVLRAACLLACLLPAAPPTCLLDAACHRLPPLAAAATARCWCCLTQSPPALSVHSRPIGLPPNMCHQAVEPLCPVTMQLASTSN